MFEIIIGNRGVGKTTELIKKSAETGVHILVPTAMHANELYDRAKQMGLSIPDSITIEEYFTIDVFQDTSIVSQGVYIDDAELVLQNLLGGIPIRSITLTRRGNVVDLGSKMKGEKYGSERL